MSVNIGYSIFRSCIVFSCMNEAYFMKKILYSSLSLLFRIFHYFFKILFIYLFICGCVGSSFLCEGFLELRRVGASLHRGARASHCLGLSCCGAQAPDAQAQ